MRASLTIALLFCLMLCGVVSCICAKSDAFDTLPTGNSFALPTPTAALKLNEDEEPPTVYAMAKIHRDELANISGGLPIVIPQGRPIAGQPWRCTWTTRPTAPFPAHDTALLVTFEQPTTPAVIPNSRGAVLRVPLSGAIRPAANTVFTQHGGIAQLHITFPHNLIGLRAWMQLIVRDPRAGVCVSPMLEIQVGNDR